MAIKKISEYPALPSNITTGDYLLVERGGAGYRRDGAYFAQGTYTPTLTNVANISASTAYAAQWYRVGDVVTVSGRIDIDITSASTATELGVSLPVSSNFSGAWQVGGTCAAETGDGRYAVTADTTNDRAAFKGNTATDITNRGHHFIFSYRVI